MLVHLYCEATVQTQLIRVIQCDQLLRFNWGRAIATWDLIEAEIIQRLSFGLSIWKRCFARAEGHLVHRMRTTDHAVICLYRHFIAWNVVSQWFLSTGRQLFHLRIYLTS